MFRVVSSYEYSRWTSASPPHERVASEHTHKLGRVSGANTDCSLFSPILILAHLACALFSPSR